MQKRIDSTVMISNYYILFGMIFLDLKEYNKAQNYMEKSLEWDEVIIEGNTAAQRFTFGGKHTGTIPMLPGEPKNKEFVLEGCTVYHIKNGKIVEFLEYSNYLGFFQQLGVIEPFDLSDR